MSRKPGRESGNPAPPPPVHPPPKAPRYYWSAFSNVYNLTVLAGGAAASALTLNPAPLLVALGLEGLWMAVGTELPPFKRAVERRHQAELTAWQKAQRQARALKLPVALQQQFEELGRLQEEIRDAWEQDPSLTRPLLAEEVARLDNLLDRYLELGEAWLKVTAHLDEVAPERVRATLNTQRSSVARMPEGPAREVAEKNVRVLEQRLERLGLLQEKAAVVRGQMNLMVSTLQLLRDQLVSPEPAPGAREQLDELLEGLEAAREALALAARAEGEVG